MEQSQMSQFCIQLNDISLPDAIAAVVEAWHDAQDYMSQDKSRANDLTPMADLAARWGVTANTVSRRLAFLGIKPIRQGNFRFLPADQLEMAEALHQHISAGRPMADFAPSVRLTELIESLPLSRGSVFALIQALNITTQKGPGPDGRGRIAWLGAADAARVADAAARVHRGEARISDLSGGA
jgi:hypothetical protein